MKLALRIISLMLVGWAVGVFFARCFIKDLDYNEARNRTAIESYNHE